MMHLEKVGQILECGREDLNGVNLGQSRLDSQFFELELAKRRDFLIKITTTRDPQVISLGLRIAYFTGDFEYMEGFIRLEIRSRLRESLCKIKSM